MDREVRILLNLDTENMIHPTRLLETSISLASSISRDLLKKKTGVSLVTNGMTRKSGRLFDTMENMKSVSFRITEDHVNLPPVGKGSDMSHALTIDKVLSSILASSGKDEFLRLLDGARCHGVCACSVHSGEGGRHLVGYPSRAKDANIKNLVFHNILFY
jgi:hypothetical protein